MSKNKANEFKRELKLAFYYFDKEEYLESLGHLEKASKIITKEIVKGRQF